MRRRRLSICSAPAAVILAGVLWVWTAIADDDARRGLIGTWEGTVTQGESSGPARLQFSERAGAVVWVWRWSAGFGRGEAEGSVVNAGEASMELRGRYTEHPARRIVGSRVTLLLRVRGTAIEGTGVTAMVNQPFALSLRKVLLSGSRPRPS